MESAGVNASFRWDGKTWVRLPRQVLVQAGDLLRLADVQVGVELLR